MEQSFDINRLMNIVRIGPVSAVDVEKHTAQVEFPDKNGLISGDLKVLRQWPVIQVEKKDDGADWECIAKYATEDRHLTGSGTYIYTKDDRDEIYLKKEITYKGETHVHEHKITVIQWLPYVGQMVVCLFVPVGKSDGFVLGGID